jgi:hypothetical protein
MLFLGSSEPGVFNMQKPSTLFDVRMISARVIAAGVVPYDPARMTPLV